MKERGCPCVPGVIAVRLFILDDKSDVRDSFGRVFLLITRTMSLQVGSSIVCTHPTCVFSL